MGVTVTRSAMLSHCRALTAACSYTEGEVIVCVLDFKVSYSLIDFAGRGKHQLRGRANPFFFPCLPYIRSVRWDSGTPCSAQYSTACTASSSRMP